MNNSTVDNISFYARLEAAKKEMNRPRYAFECNTGKTVSAAWVGRHIEIIVFNDFSFDDYASQSSEPEWFFDVEEMIKRFSQLVAENTV